MSQLNSANLGFKRIDVNNWLEIDGAWTGVVMGSSDPEPGRAWVKDVMGPRLNEATPAPVVRLFEAARGALVFALFFYPLLALGMEQLARVIEAAVAAKCRDLGAPPGATSFRIKVDWLISKDVIPNADAERWRASVQLRNITSHPDEQNIYPPAWALGDIHRTVAMINVLYPSS